MASSTAKFKLESGIQLLSRLTRKPEIENIHPVLFEKGPSYGQVIEIFGSDSISCMVFDIISDVLVPVELNGHDTGVIVFNTNGNFDFELLVNITRKKLLQRIQLFSLKNVDIEQILCNSLQKLHILKIYDATQFYTSIYNLENILTDHPDISLLLIDTITAFYWSEQGFKITKMDLYIKNILQTVQKITKEYRILILYTRPEYFNSSKDSIENMESCCDKPTLERVNYRLQLFATGDKLYEVNVQSYGNLYKKQFSVLQENEINWL